MEVTYHPIGVAVLLGRLAAISFVALTLFSGLRVGPRLLYVGLALYALGYLVVMVSLSDYSRNPQWLGLVAVFVGTVLAMGAWLHLLLVLILATAYHLQILLEEEICASTRGAKYRDYMSRVPRYLIA